GVLRQAGLVVVRRDGTRRFYRANREALAPFASLLQQMWAAQLDTLADLAERAETTERLAEPAETAEGCAERVESAERPAGGEGRGASGDGGKAGGDCGRAGARLMTGVGSDLVTVRRRVRASPATVFSFFTDPQRWLSWQGVDATIEPRPGGLFRMNVRGDGY